MIALASSCSVMFQCCVMLGRRCVKVARALDNVMCCGLPLFVEVVDGRVVVASTVGRLFGCSVDWLIG